MFLLFAFILSFTVSISISVYSENFDYSKKNNTYIDDKTYQKSVEYNKMLSDNKSMERFKNNYSDTINKGINNSKQYYNISKDITLPFMKKENIVRSAQKQHKEIFKGNIDIKQDNTKEKSCNNEDELGNPKLFIFISSSLPNETIENYMNFAKQHKDKVYLVLNGFIGNDISKIRPTVNFISKISCGLTLDEIQKKKDKNFKCDIARVDINPLLFKAFKVDKVPAIVYSYISYADIMNSMSIPDNANPIKDSDFLLIYGDVSMKYALEKFETVDANIGKEFKKK